jgi:arsenate reductase (thioredoxin)
MGLFNHLAGGGAVVWSGGSEPTGKINPAAVAVMAERGIDISGEYPKPWTGEIIAAADVIVSMGCGDRVPALRGVDTKTGTLTTRPAKTWPRCG